MRHPGEGVTATQKSTKVIIRLFNQEEVSRGELLKVPLSFISDQTRKRASFTGRLW